MKIAEKTDLLKTINLPGTEIIVSSVMINNIMYNSYK